MLTVVTALPWEAGAAVRLLDAPRRRPFADGWCVDGAAPDGRPVRVIMSGAGPARAGAGAAAWRELAPAGERLVSFGVAGGLAAGLRPGAIVVADRQIDEGRGPLDAGAGADWSERLAARLSAGGLRVTRGASLTVERGLLTPAAKREAHARTQAHIVQMEDSVWAAAAAAAGTPFASVRVVLDEAGSAVPAAVMRWHWPPTAGEVAGSLLRRPALAADLVRLARRRRSADRGLRAVAPLLLAGDDA